MKDNWVIEEFFTEPYYSVEYIINNIRNAINNKLPYSICRVGDAESAIIGQINIFDLDFIKMNWPQFFIDRDGFIKLPDFQIRDELIEAFRNSDILSMFALDKHMKLSNYDVLQWHGKLMRDALGYYNLIPNRYMYTFANIELMRFPKWWKLFKDYKTALVGVHMQEVGEILKQCGCNIVYTADLNNHNLINTRINELKNIDFDWAICSAGASAKVFINKVKQLGFVGFDFGSSNKYFLNMYKSNSEILLGALK